MNLNRFNTFKTNEDIHVSPRGPKEYFGLKEPKFRKTYLKPEIEEIAYKYGLNEILYALLDFYKNNGEKAYTEMVEKWIEEYEKFIGVENDLELEMSEKKKHKK